MKQNEIRALYDEDTITVYQAYNTTIAEQAVKHQKFVAPFKIERMTWIKPSFLWMMYRSGWGTKDGQESVLAIKIRKEGFDWALKNSCLSRYESKYYKNEEEWKNRMQTSSVRIQWDPEKDIFLNNLDYRSIQIGLKDIAVQKYVNEWIVSIEDISERCLMIKDLIANDRQEDAIKLLPPERIYIPSDKITPFS